MALGVALELALLTTACGDLGDELRHEAAANAGERVDTGATPDPDASPDGGPAPDEAPGSVPTRESGSAGGPGGSAEPLPEYVPGPTAYPEDPTAPECAGPDITVRVAGFDVAAGTRYLLLEATNVAQHPCAVKGRPVLEFLRSSGTLTPRVEQVKGRPEEPPRVVVPPGAAVRCDLVWRGMSTSLDPDVTVAIDVRPIPGSDPTRLWLADVVLYDGSVLESVDILDGAEVRVGPWASATAEWG